jgi:hypothetical protein
MGRLLGVIVMGLGGLGAILFFIAGLILLSSAVELIGLRSQSGTSVAEAYYQQMGRHGLAYSIISFACSFGLVSISLGVGRLLQTFEKSRRAVDHSLG